MEGTSEHSLEEWCCEAEKASKQSYCLDVGACKQVDFDTREVEWFESTAKVLVVYMVFIWVRDIVKLLNSD
jgi:hypothetical protein